MTRADTLPSVDDLIKGRVYRIHCRNLTIGVWNGIDGFIGIRTKFGDRYLFTEYHWDADPNYGTVRDAKDLGVDVPEDIEVADNLLVTDQGPPLFRRNKALFNFLDNLEL